ncbi:hypothetical protein EV182_004931 [Spiromyces aspiralis]|uniref:Uncharacterized protein n=1 Tax=Spiromyces aspiralis TaxID=68401 RepID=A0ACC1HNA4_9FUNG|nr:hypothetical protein EV182_004931 [Spiromyces aspiralis]
MWPLSLFKPSSSHLLLDGPAHRKSTPPIHQQLQHLPSLALRLNVYETCLSYIVLVKLAGYLRDEVEVSIRRHQLVFKGIKLPCSSRTAWPQVRKRFVRKAQLLKDSSMELAKANFKYNVLMTTVSKVVIALELKHEA